MKEQNNKKVKIVGVIVLVVVVVSVIVGIFAFNRTEKPNKNIPEMFGSLMGNVIEHPNLYGVDDIEVSDLKVLNEVKIYNLKDNNKDVKENKENSVTNYPVMIDDDIELIFAVIKKDGERTATLGTDFAPLLNLAKHNGAKEVKVIQDEYTFYAITDDKIYKQAGEAVTEISKDEVDFSYIENLPITKLNDVNDKLTKLAISSCEKDKNK